MATLSKIGWKHLIIIITTLAASGWALTTGHTHQKYVQERELIQIIQRLDRIENKLDKLLEDLN